MITRRLPWIGAAARPDPAISLCHAVAGFRLRDSVRIVVVGLGVKGQWLLCSRLELIGLLLMLLLSK